MNRWIALYPRNSARIIGGLLVLISILHLSSSATSDSPSKRKLKLVHVIFAHKLHAPIENNTEYGLPKKLDYEYFLENALDMANESKVEMYDLGVYLRRRYNEFLGDIYYPEVLKMRTSEYVLSMIAGLLVNAGLWPPAPSQKWKDDLDWQPIPSEYEQKEKDVMFLGTLCPRFIAEEKNLPRNDEYIKNAIKVHEPLFEYISSHYGKIIERPSEIALLYSSLETTATLRNETLPGWAESIFPYGEMMNVSLLAYEMLSRTANQKRLNGGIFLKNVIADSARILSMNNTSGVVNNSRGIKISMYSGEDRNLIGVMQAMNLWWSPHIPESGASIIFELRYDESTKKHGFEIFYYTGAAVNETIGLTVPGCAGFCSLDDFERIVADMLPTDAYKLCHSELTISGNTNSSGSELRLRFSFLSLISIFSISALI